MAGDLIAAFCEAARSGELHFTPHHFLRLATRPSPNESETSFILCEDAPEIIEESPETSRCLIWGQIRNNEIAHLLCEYWPGFAVITAYFPALTEPDSWSSDFRLRLKSDLLE